MNIKYKIILFYKLYIFKAFKQ